MSAPVPLVAAPPAPPPPPAVQPAGLFGAVADPVTGRVQPVPVLRLGGTADGADVASGPAADGSWPALMVVAGLSVTWGRTEVLAQPTPATASLSLFDPSGSWAAHADLIGRPFQLRWEHRPPGGPVTVTTFFRGRVASVAVTPKTVLDPAGRPVDGALIDLQGTSILTDLGNRRPAEAQWPAETFTARTARLLALSAERLSALNPRSYWSDAVAAPLTDAAQTTALDQITDLFNSCGCDRYSYNVGTQAIDWLGRRNFPNASGLAYLAWNPAVRTGCYIAALPVNRGDGGAFSAPNFLDGRTVQYDAAVTKDMGSKLTRVELTYQNVEAGNLSEKGQAAQAIADRIASGEVIYEDLTWRGYPQPVANHNDELVTEFYAANPGSDWPGNKPAVRSWLLAFIAADQKQGSTYASQTITELIPGTDESVVGQRSATVTTVHTDPARAQVCADDLAGLAAGEASGWAMDPMSWDTTRTDGFETLDQALLLLSGFEQFSIYFLAASWLPALGVRPVFGVMGGTISYARRGWQVQWNNAPVQVTEAQQYAITWDHCDDGSTAHTLVWDEDDNPNGMHDSVTWEDLEYVALGFGVQTIPTDGA